MTLTDLITLGCLATWLAGSLVRESTPRNALLWLTALAALVLGLRGVAGGRWQAWGVVVAAGLAFAPLVRAALIERAVPAAPRSRAGWFGRALIAVLIVVTGYLFR